MTALDTLIERRRDARGTQLPRFTMMGRTGAPIVAVLGGISATRHVAFGPTPAEPGWWPAVVGEDRAIDLNRFRVLGIDFMDGGRAANGMPRRTVTTHDQARWLAHVVRAVDAASVHAIVGCSYGGMVALAFAELHPSLVERLVVISAAHESHPMSTAWRSLQRRTVELGLHTGSVDEAMSIARGLAMTTYRTPGEFADRFPTCHPEPSCEGPLSFPVDRYLRHKGARFAESMRPERFLALSLSADLHCVDPARITTPVTLIAAEGDAIVPRVQMEALANRLPNCPALVDLPTRVGHDAFLVEAERVSAILSNVLA